MRAYRLHSASWATIVTHRVRRPESIASRLTSRRRPEAFVPSDGQLVLLRCNHQFDPRSGEPVERRELLDRIIEALSIPEVDGVIASADLLEELPLLNMVEHKLALCQNGPPVATLAANHFDGAMVMHQDPAAIANAATELATHGLPTIAALTLGDAGEDFVVVMARLDVASEHDHLNRFNWRWLLADRAGYFWIVACRRGERIPRADARHRRAYSSGFMAELFRKRTANHRSGHGVGRKRTVPNRGQCGRSNRNNRPGSSAPSRGERVEARSS